ncbi:GAF and ANTAR domain-containing protein [Cumulibacter manganitolerans]|uniref:GAF and ANTAR domain-containing protein n=1 Tax=Cumulibacter manganitolerans TaxID=1884992 RepID=UPI0018863182|nr:GAF and ANTAR domain-containing protein [Cumulibacter manganitolerans]
MDGPDGLRMAEIAARLHRDTDEDLTVDSIVSLAVEVIPDAQLASVTLNASRRAGFATLGATSDIARQVDQHQYDLLEGAAVETAEREEWVRSGDLDTDGRWPRWGAEAADLGVLSVLSVALKTEERRTGALNLYSLQRGRFADRETVEVALMFGVHASSALAASRVVSGLENALSTRHTIGIAQGMLMERYQLSLDQSFNVLRRVSSHENTKLAQVARQLVETGSLPTSPEQEPSVESHPIQRDGSSMGYVVADSRDAAPDSLDPAPDRSRERAAD